MSPFDRPRAVTFDCWGTLIHELDSQAARALRVDALGEAAGLAPHDAAALLQDAWEQHHAAWQRHEQFGSVGMVDWVASRVPLTQAGRASVLAAFEESAVETGVSAVAGGADTLVALRDAGFATALVCDTGFTPGRVVRSLLDAHGLAELLDAFAFSDEVGVPKPHPRMFATALGSIGGGPAIHVGDLRRTDVAGARGAGLGAVRFRGIYDDESEHPDADVVIDDLRALPGLLGLAS